MSRQWLLALCAAVAFAVPMSGCGGGSGLKLQKVSGVVTFDGKPLTKGNVQFTPDGSKGTRGPMATGAIGPDGRFTLTTTTSGDGAPVGFYRVTVNCWDEGAPFDPKNPKPPTPARSLIPERYTDDNASGLTAEVKAGAKNEFTFELKK